LKAPRLPIGTPRGTLLADNPETAIIFRSSGASGSPGFRPPLRAQKSAGSTHDCRRDFAQNLPGAMLYCDRLSVRRSALVLRQIAISLGLLVVASSPLGAQVTVDVSKLTCEQFATYKVTNPKYLAVWLSGYDHGRRGDVVIDMQQLVANTEKLEDYCLKNPTVPMMKAAETILEPQKQ
jgi:acid stress chaperone HdeB